jgi:hypothetical protein
MGKPKSKGQKKDTEKQTVELQKEEQPAPSLFEQQLADEVIALFDLAFQVQADEKGTPEENQRRWKLLEKAEHFTYARLRLATNADLQPTTCSHCLRFLGLITSGTLVGCAYCGTTPGPTFDSGDMVSRGN